MLLAISLKDQPTNIHNININNVDDKVRRFMKFTIVPNHDSIDMACYNLVNEIGKCFEDRKKEAEVQRKLIDDWVPLYEALSDEDKKKYDEEGYLESIGAKPYNVETYNGVLICEDVPAFMIPPLYSYLHGAGFSVYYKFEYYEIGVIGKKDTHDPSVKENITGPVGKPKLLVFPYRPN